MAGLLTYTLWHTILYHITHKYKHMLLMKLLYNSELWQSKCKCVIFKVNIYIMLVRDSDTANTDLNGWIMDSPLYYSLSKLLQTVRVFVAEILFLLLF